MSELPYFPQLDERITSLQHERKKRRSKYDFDEHQSPLPFNRIVIERGIQLAPQGKHAKKGLEAKEADYLVNELLDEFRVYSGLQRFNRTKYYTALSMILANAKVSAETNSQVIIGRRNGLGMSANPRKIRAELTNALLDFLSDKNLITYFVGKANEYDENSSWFIPLPRLINRLAHAKVIGHNKGYVLLHDENKLLKEWSKMRSVQLDVARMNKEMSDYCTLLFEHEVTFGGVKLIPFAKRIFNRHIGLGGRIYAEWQQLPKEDRARIRIDNSKTAELDYSQIHYQILYAQEGQELIGDPYTVEGYERDTIKRVSLVMLNSESLVTLAKQITKSSKPEMKAAHNEFKNRWANYEYLRGKGLRTFIPVKSPKLQGFIEGIPEGTKGKELLEMLLERHKGIAHRLGTPDIGLRLQNADSKIIAECVKRATELVIPVLPVHDSLICQAKHKGIIYGIMRDVFREQYGREIEVKY